MLNCNKLNTLQQLYNRSTEPLNKLSDSIPQLFLRLILAWEFGESGFEKLYGTNWFADVVFPFPFNLLSPDIGWGISTFFEIVGAFALVFGIATRFFSFSLMILTIVAISAVHWPEHWSSLIEILKGYRVIDEQGDGFGNYKLPIIYLVMFLPLLFGGAGKLSTDYFITKEIFSKR
jgi:putative oxidoreductase